MPKDKTNDKDSLKNVSSKNSGKSTFSGVKTQLDFSNTTEMQVKKKLIPVDGEPSNVINVRNRDVGSIRTPSNSHKAQRKEIEGDQMSRSSSQRQRSVETCEIFNE